MTATSDLYADECRFVEVLTAKTESAKIGYRIGGGRPGPNALVMGDPALIEAVFNRLLRLPTLPWMWGSLFLVSLNADEILGRDNINGCLPDVAFDDFVLPPYVCGEETHDLCVDQAYWSSLRLCRNLGMIQGRGIT